MTEPARAHPTSADQLDTGSGSEGATAAFLGQSQGHSPGALHGRGSAQQKLPLNFEFTSQRTLQAGSKETIAVARNKDLNVEGEKGNQMDGAIGRQRLSEDAEAH